MDKNFFATPMSIDLIFTFYLDDNIKFKENIYFGSYQKVMVAEGNDTQSVNICLTKCGKALASLRQTMIFPI